MLRALHPKPADGFEAQCRADMIFAPAPILPGSQVTSGGACPSRQHFIRRRAISPSDCQPHGGALNAPTDSGQSSPDMTPDSPEAYQQTPPLTPALPRGASIRDDLFRAIHGANPVVMGWQLVGLVAVFWLIELAPQIIAFLGTP